jgi:hypothetical protein
MWFLQLLLRHIPFIYKQGSQTAYLLLNVDDIILTASDDQLLRHIIASLSTEFAMTDLGTLHHFFGDSGY